MAEASGKKYAMGIEKGIHITGNRENIIQMMNLLIDNAYKYSNDAGEIEVSLRAKGKKKLIEVKNTTDGVEKGDLGILFERFYRSDSSRSSETGGHGIGLSVVSAIAEAHRGRAEAKSPDGKWVVFSVTLP
jgi:signal transduction histidine kinase